MYITEVSIKRPATAAVFSLLIIVFGLYLFFQIPVRELPKNIQNQINILHNEIRKIRTEYNNTYSKK